MKNIQLFLLQLGCSKKEEHHRRMESFTKAGWKLWLSGTQRSPPPHLPNVVQQAYMWESWSFSPLAGIQQENECSGCVGS